MHRIWQQCQAGHFEVGTQAGHLLGVYSHAYAGEVSLGRILADPTGELAALKEQVRASYPQPLRESLVANARWEAPFTLSIGRKGVTRGDAFYIVGCLFRVVGILVHALHALHAQAGCWVLNEKGAVQAAAQPPTAPANFSARAHALFGALGATPDELTAAIDDAEQLAADVLDNISPG
ncbi:DUF4037 domain-containing protein [Streptomyces sp. NPDC059556]|uniref:DUF4037 domain-containing protein n=1 Tax=Streptomyces sp. NPDC059556 TaxID=3346863 RepID=UPI0036BBC4F9